MCQNKSCILICAIYDFQSPLTMKLCFYAKKIMFWRCFYCFDKNIFQFCFIVLISIAHSISHTNLCDLFKHWARWKKLKKIAKSLRAWWSDGVTISFRLTGISDGWDRTANSSLFFLFKLPLQKVIPFDNLIPLLHCNLIEDREISNWKTSETFWYKYKEKLYTL